MSNLTHIPKWDPNHAFAKPEKKRTNGPRYNFRKRVPEMNDRSCKTLLKSKSKRSRDADPLDGTWYTGNGRVPEESDEPQASRATRSYVTEDRITRRVGMFRNSKQSSLVYGDLPSAVRRNVDRAISRIVAPDDDVEYIRPPVEELRKSTRRGTREPSPEYRENRRDSRAAQKKRDGNRGRGEETERKKTHKRLRRDDDYEEEEGRNSSFRGMSQRDVQLPNRGSAMNTGDDHRGGLYQSGYRPRIQQPVRTTTSFRAVHGSQNSSNSSRDSGVQSDVVSGPGSRESSQRLETTSSLRRFAAAQEAIVRTPGRNLSQDSCAAESDGTTPYPSKTLVKRILAAMPALSLRDDRDNRYATAARNLLCGSISQQEDKNTLLQSLFNKTSTLHYQALSQSQREGDEVHEHLFQPDSPHAGGFTSSTPPPTPALEREFNQTMQAEREKELSREFRAPEINNNFDLLTPGAPLNAPGIRTPMTQGGFEDMQSPVYLQLDGPGDGFPADFPQPSQHSPPQVVSPFAGNDFLMQLDEEMNAAVHFNGYDLF